MSNFDLKKYLKENRVNEIGTPEQEKIQKVITQYVNLRKAIDNPNYPDTPHTYSAMKKVENILKQMDKQSNFHFSLIKMLPTEYQDFLSQNTINEQPIDPRFVPYQADDRLLEVVKYDLKNINQKIPTQLNLVFQHETFINDDGDIVVKFYSKPRKRQ